MSGQQVAPHIGREDTSRREPPDAAGSDARDQGGGAPPRRWAVPVLVTGIALLAAGLGCWTIWDAFVAAPWTATCGARRAKRGG